ncbi:MAG: hypothetical protein DME19_10825 [Verrucomicrobia bacterium]|nr:MAG: hypothetical protein DME19_10825 [Verrucomicrobiota bacterium]
MSPRPISVAWISNFPVEWIGDLPGELKNLPKRHAMTWQRVLLDEFKVDPRVNLHVVVLRKGLERNYDFDGDGVSFHVLKVPAGLRGPTFFWTDTILIRRVLDEVRPDVVHAWGTERGAALVADRLSYPYVVTIQGLLMWYVETVPINLHFRYASFLERISLPRAPLVTTESTFAVQYLRSKFPGMRVEQAEHAPNWVFHRIQRRPRTGPIRFIFVGTLDQRKGGDLLLAALDRLKDELAWELLVIGAVEETFLTQLRAGTSIGLWDRIQFKRDLSPAEVASELGEATIMLFPTRADTSPNAVKEAVVAGVPVVASAVGGIPDYVIRAGCKHPLFSRGLVTPGSLEKNRAYLSPTLMAKRFLEAYQSVLKRD